MITPTETYKDQITIKPVESNEELHRATTLILTSHQNDASFPSEWLQKNGATYPHFKREHTRIALWNDEIVGVLRITTDTIRIGEARLKMGGLGGLSIAPAFKNRNVQELLIEQTLEYLKEHRYHITMSFTQPRAYELFGFSEAIADYTVHINCSKSPVPRNCNRRTRRIKPGDIGALQRVQSYNSADIACSILRERAHFTNKWERINNTIALTDDRGKIEGYLSIRNGVSKLHIDEAEACSDAAYRDLIAYAFRTAKEHLMARLVFHLPPNHPMMLTLSQVVRPEAVRYHSGSVGMLRMLDFEETLESMIPEWESRVDRSLLREMDCEVTLVIENKPYRIRVHFGAMDIASQMGKNKFSVDSATFSQLLTGYRDVREIWPQEHRLITRESRTLLEVLFPKQSPYISLFDRF